MKKDIATNKRDKADGDELKFKLIVAGLILLIPFIIIYELVESSWFKCYPRKRKDEYRDMQNRRVTEAGRIKPEFKDFEFCRNKNRLILHFSSSQAMYPSCEVTLYVPNDKADEFAKIPWQKETIDMYSVRVPGIFHSYWAEGKVSDIIEHGWLRKFQQDYRLIDAVPVINYMYKDSSDFIWYKHLNEYIIEESFPFEKNEKVPVQCSVELLSFKEPMQDTEWQFVEYRCCPLGLFTLERNCFDRLTDKSKRKLDKILEGYGAYM